MRDDTLYTIGPDSPDRKARTERLIVLQRQIARGKPLERVERTRTWELTIGVGCFALIVLGVLAFVAGVALGYINVM